MAQERRDVSIVVKCQCEGFGFDLTAELAVDQIEGLMKKLRASGVEPAQTPYTWKDQGKGSVSNGHNNGAPVCPHHNAPMQPSTKGSGWYCPRKLSDGTYCKEKAS